MGDVTLSYLVAHPASLGLAVTRPALLSLLGATAVFIAWPMSRQRRNIGLRAAAFASIVLCLAGVQLTTSLPANDLALVVAVDVSGSIDDSGLDWSRRRLEEVAGALAPGDFMAVVSFAESSELIATNPSTLDTSKIGRTENVSATDISAAIDQALAMYPQGSQKALLLLSDGNETIGNSRNRIETLNALGVRVHAAAPHEETSLDVRITKLTAPNVTDLDRPVPTRVVIRNPSGPRDAVLNLYLDGSMSDSTAIELRPGLNTFDMLLRAPGIGGHTIRAEIATDGDRSLHNNSREVSLTVSPKTRVLLASNRRHSRIGQVLRAGGFSVHEISSSRLPRNVAGYASIHLAVLEDISGKSLSPQSTSALEEFVRQRGGGLIFAGGSATFGDPAYQDTKIEAILPVTMEPRRPRPRKRDPLALFLVIDRSNSMGFNSRIGTLRDGEKLRYAIKAGIAVVKQLKDQDLVGVIAFDARPHEIAPLEPLRQNRKALLEELPRIVESGGTDFFDSLEAAAEQLMRSRVSHKHVVLLTDGDTNRAGHGEYRELVAKLAAAQISVTTIRIGDNTVNLKLLQDISEGTGGSFHHVENAQMLPDLMLRDTSRALGKLNSQSERFFPAVGVRHMLLDNLEEGDLPYLSNYAFSKPKPSSETLLHVLRSDRRDPIVSVWRYGLGRVAAFTASPADDAETWPGWQSYKQFWSQLGFWTARRESDEDIAVGAVRYQHSTQVTALSFDTTDSDAILSGTVAVGADRVRLDFSAGADGSFHAAMPPLEQGRYALTLRVKSSSGAVREISTTLAVPAQIEEGAREYGHEEINRDLLRELTSRTGGTLDATVKQITDRPIGERSIAYPLTSLLIPLATLLFFIDIATQRIEALRSNPPAT